MTGSVLRSYHWSSSLLLMSFWLLRLVPLAFIVLVTPLAASLEITLAYKGVSIVDRILVFQKAARRWEDAITSDLPDVNGLKIKNQTSDTCPIPGHINDLFICALYHRIDGPGNVAGYGGVQYLRSDGSLLPLTGIMVFDRIDLLRLRILGVFQYVILHEMCHVLGFGTLWERKNLTLPRDLGCPYRYNSMASDNWRYESGCNTSVPVENNSGSAGTDCYHWDENCLGAELMSGTLQSPSAANLSKITIGSMEDLGYHVNYRAADPYDVVRPHCTCKGKEQAQELQDDHYVPRPELSEQGRAKAVAYGKSILEQSRKEAKARRLHETSSDAIFVGDQYVDVLFLEGNSVFTVSVTEATI